MIETRGLTKLFKDKKRGEIRAVDGVSFTCKPGEIYGLLGANGAGKTTTLRMLATILEPTDGTAIVCGYDVLESPQKVRANVGFLSTATALYPRLTSQEMVEYFGRLNGLAETELKKRVDEIFTRLEDTLADHEGRILMLQLCEKDAGARREIARGPWAALRNQQS